MIPYSETLKRTKKNRFRSRVNRTNETRSQSDVPKAILNSINFNFQTFILEKQRGIDFKFTKFSHRLFSSRFRPYIILSPQKLWDKGSRGH